MTLADSTSWSAIEHVAEIGTGELMMSSRCLGWSDIEVERFRHHERELALPPFTRHLVIVHLGRSATIFGRLGRIQRRCKANPWEISVVPAGLPTTWSFETSGADTLHVYLTPAIVAEVAARSGQADPATTRIRERLAVRDPSIADLSQALLDEAADPRPAGGVVAASFATILATHLIRRHSAAFDAPSRAREGGLPDAVMRRVNAHIERNLAGDLSVGALATTVGVSADHFSRLFRKTTGHTPHAYVIHRRVDQARDLLRAGGRSIAEVALAVGFADQSHLTRHFGRRLGITPARFQRARAILPNQDVILQDLAG